MWLNGALRWIDWVATNGGCILLFSKSLFYVAPHRRIFLSLHFVTGEGPRRRETMRFSHSNEWLCGNCAASSSCCYCSHSSQAHFFVYLSQLPKTASWRESSRPFALSTWLGVLNGGSLCLFANHLGGWHLMERGVANFCFEWESTPKSTNWQICRKAAMPPPSFSRVVISY